MPFGLVPTVTNACHIPPDGVMATEIGLTFLPRGTAGGLPRRGLLDPRHGLFGGPFGAVLLDALQPHFPGIPEADQAGPDLALGELRVVQVVHDLENLDR